MCCRLLLFIVSTTTSKHTLLLSDVYLRYTFIFLRNPNDPVVLIDARFPRTYQRQSLGLKLNDPQLNQRYVLKSMWAEDCYVVCRCDSTKCNIL